jgi:hypothetical protein
MARANAPVRSIDQESIGADRLISTVFEHDRFAKEPAKKKRNERRIRHMDDIGCSNALE